MIKKEETRFKKISILCILIIFSAFIVGIASYLYGNGFGDIVRICSITIVSSAILGFSLVQSYLHKSLHNDNHVSFVRLVIIVLAGLVLGCSLPVISYSIWIFPVMALAFSLFSNSATGIIAYTEVFSIYVYFSLTDISEFLIYLLCGAMFVVLFEKVEENGKTGVPIFISISIYSVIVFEDIVFGDSVKFNIESIFIAIVYVFITLIFVFIVLRLFFVIGIDKDKDRYLVINDVEYELLSEYKEKDKQLYFNAIHTAYFAEKTARLLHMDVDAAKTGGYYHKIIVEECKQQNKSLEEMCKQYKFPQKSVKLLQEINYKSQPLRMKESVVVYLADSVVSSIAYFINKDKENNENKTENIDFSKLATAIIKRKIDSGVLNKSEISFADLIKINKIYTGEKTYYDFLRRE